MENKTPPILEQYRLIKSRHRDRILLFQLGDFFEMFAEDAEKAASLLNIALTKRYKGTAHETFMCGVPRHSIAGPISKLLAEGLSVAVCAQTEEASPEKKLLRRAVTRTLSPGMVYDPETLDRLQANYMAAFDGTRLSFLDASTGEGFWYETEDGSHTDRLLAFLNPVEIVAQKGEAPPFPDFPTSFFDPTSLSPQAAAEAARFLKERAGARAPLPKSAETLVRYAVSMQGSAVLKALSGFENRNLKGEMFLSSRLLDHLEVFRNSEGETGDSLFAVVNRAKTPVGARALKKRLRFPLKNQQKIEQRLDRIQWWIDRPSLLEEVRRAFSSLGDSERKLNKAAHSHCNPRDLREIAEVLERGLKAERAIRPPSSPSKAADESAVFIRDEILRLLKDNPPALRKDGGFIKESACKELAALSAAAQTNLRRLFQMERAEQARTGIPSLKIRYNHIFGYYIEVRKTHLAKIPGDYIRKQTLVNAERCATPALSALEGEILSVREARIRREEEIFQELLQKVLDRLPELLKLCARWGRMDLDSSLAYSAIENNYVRPRFGKRFHLVNSRHPVLERKSLFTPNTLDLAPGETLILTGPNMGGKSTLMRQAALAVLLAQSGCFVPAESAESPLFHKMFTRMGAGDSLSKKLSTFMMEMKETGEILQKADSKSLVLLDEIGRGTSTFDGMSLAQALIEFLTEEKQALTLSATHYHELTRLADRLPAVKNGSLTAIDQENEIKFLYTLQEGPARKSYGIEVARLAGLPSSVVKRAYEILESHELKGRKSAPAAAAGARPAAGRAQNPAGADLAKSRRADKAAGAEQAQQQATGARPADSGASAQRAQQKTVRTGESVSDPVRREARLRDAVRQDSVRRRARPRLQDGRPIRNGLTASGDPDRRPIPRQMSFFKRNP